MLLLAYMEREDSIPPVLKSDLTFVLQKSPVLLEEMLKIAALPRPPYGYGWMVSDARTAVNGTHQDLRPSLHIKANEDSPEAEHSAAYPAHTLVWVCMLPVVLCHVCTLQTPAIAIVEMKQSLAQAVSLSERKPLGKQIDPSAFLVQLPHITSDTIKKLKRRKINSIKGEYTLKNMTQQRIMRSRLSSWHVLV